ITPRNVLWRPRPSRQRHLLLADFNLAVPVPAPTGLYLDTCRVGTANYMSPEIYAHQRYSAASDMWAFGCFAFELLSLNLAFTASTSQRLVQKIACVQYPEIPKHVPPGIQTLVQHLLAYHPSERPTAQGCLAQFQRQYPVISDPTRNYSSPYQFQTLASTALVSSNAHAQIAQLPPQTVSATSPLESSWSPQQSWKHLPGPIERLEMELALLMAQFTGPRSLWEQAYQHALTHCPPKISPYPSTLLDYGPRLGISIRQWKAILQHVHQLQGIAPTPDYVRTTQIEIANIKWDHHDAQAVVKAELWDVVDKSDQRRKLGQHLKLQHSTAAASSIKASASPSARSEYLDSEVALDADTINVYRDCNCAIVLFDIRKPWTFEYAIGELRKIPFSVATLLIGNFAQHANERQVPLGTIRSALARLCRRRAQQASAYQAERQRYSLRPSSRAPVLESAFDYYPVPILRYTECNLMPAPVTLPTRSGRSAEGSSRSPPASNSTPTLSKKAVTSGVDSAAMAYVRTFLNIPLLQQQTQDWFIKAQRCQRELRDKVDQLSHQDVPGLDVDWATLGDEATDTASASESSDSDVPSEPGSLPLEPITAQSTLDSKLLTEGGQHLTLPAEHAAFANDSDTMGFTAPGADDLYSDFLDDDNDSYSTDNESSQHGASRLERTDDTPNVAYAHQQPPISRSDHSVANYSRSSSPDSDANPMVTQEEDLDEDLMMPFPSGSQHYRLQQTVASHPPAVRAEASHAPPRTSLMGRSASAFIPASRRSDTPRAGDATLETRLASTSPPAMAPVGCSESESEVYDPAHYSPLVDKELDSDNPWAISKS
ncbi:hypothetical protein H4R35_006019, partial [Dimargaris xerosporica]